jgi:hypothetical protein
MRRTRYVASVVSGAVAVCLILIVAGCGASTSATPLASAAATPAGAAPSTAATTTASASASSGALTGEAASAAAGDIPDNQVFLIVNDKTLGFSMKYPEGWAQKSAANGLTIRDKNNIVHVLIQNAPAPTTALVTQELAMLKQQAPSLKAGTPADTTISGRPAIKVSYTTVSAPNPVTGKSVTLMVDRYYFWHAGRVAIVDLGTPKGVDNVDAYRMMSESFTWIR